MIIPVPWRGELGLGLHFQHELYDPHDVSTSGRGREGHSSPHSHMLGGPFREPLHLNRQEPAAEN